MTLDVDKNTTVRIERDKSGLYVVRYNGAVHYAETATGAMLWVLSQTYVGGVH